MFFRISLLGLITVVAGACTVLFRDDSLCDVDADCDSGRCLGGFCRAEGEGEGEGEPGEGEGEQPGEGEGEGEPGEGEGEGEPGEGEGEGEGEVLPPQVVCGVAVSAAWADRSFPRRVPVGVCDAGAPATTVVNGVLMVKLSGADIDFDDLRNDGVDVAFFDQRLPGAVRLDYERQLFVNNAGIADEAIFWVRLPSISPRAGDAIWMYYGSANPTDDSDGNAAFAAYNAGWHFDDVATNVRLPEIRSGIASRVLGLGDNASTAPGIAGRALDLSGEAFVVLDDTNNPELVGNQDPFGLTTTQGSFSFVVGPRENDAAGLSIGQAVFLADGEAPLTEGFDQRSVHLTIASSLDNGNGVANSIGFSLPTNPPRPTEPSFVATGFNVIDRNAFNHVAASWTPSQVNLFVNGELVSTVNTTSVPFTLRFIDIGTSQQLARVLRGRMDELRMANAPRDAAFARFEARSVLDQLVQLGVVEQRP